MNEVIRESWWDRNWKWFVPAGCLLLILAAAGAAVALLSIVSAGMKSSGAYKEGFARARTDCELQEKLGAPIAAGAFFSGSIQVTGPTGRADISVPLKGSKRSGKLYVGADKKADRWIFDFLEVAIDGEPQRLDLLQNGRRLCP